MTVQVEGLARLNRTLTKFGTDMQNLKAAHVRVAQYVIAAAKPTAPRRTGRLAGDMRAANTKNKAAVYVGRASIPYAGPIHYGWPARNITAQPWLLTTIHNTEPAWLSMYMTEVDHALAQVKGA